MPIIHMLNADRVPNCEHGRPQDDWCIRCIADDLIEMRLQGLSYAKCGAARGISATTARAWMRHRAQERRIDLPERASK